MSQESEISRSDILSGALNRQPGRRLLAQIEARTAFMVEESRRLISAFFLEQDENFSRHFDLQYSQAVKARAETASEVSLADLEQFAPAWKSLVPEDIQARVELVHQLVEKYDLRSQPLSRLGAVLGVEQDALQDAYFQAYHQWLYELFDLEMDMAREAGATSDLSENTLSKNEDEAFIHAAARRIEWITIGDGEVLYRQEDPSDSLYILIGGRLRSEIVDKEGECIRVDQIGRGELAGEMEVFSGEPRAATVTAIRDSELAKLPAESLQWLAYHYPVFMLRINQRMAKRLRHLLTRRPRKHHRLVTFTIIAHRPSQARGERSPAGQLTRRLVAALERFGPTLHLTEEKIDERLGAGAAQISREGQENGQIAAWLSEQESHYRFIVYEANAELTQWTQRCLHQADRIILAAEARGNPQPGEIERYVNAEISTARMDLALLYPAHTNQPHGTIRWLKMREVKNYYHIRLEEEDDLARLARRLTGQAVGLVLSGGGARGFAHIGVYEALRESGFQIDLIGGTSMGAILGGAYAMGKTSADLFDFAKSFASPLKLFDLTLPVVSFFSSGKATEVLRKIYGEIAIEDLWRPYFCMSSNLTRATPVVHRSGKLWQAARASSSIPGIFSPVVHEGDLLVDGAVLNNLPVDVMRNFSQGGPVVAVNVFPEVDLDKQYHFGPSVSGWRSLIDHLNPLQSGSSAPWIFESLMRVIALNDVHQAKAKRELVDLYIRPQVEKYNILDFGAFRPIIELGHQAGQQAISQWKQEAGGALDDLPLAAALPKVEIDRLSQALDELDQVLTALVE